MGRLRVKTPFLASGAAALFALVLLALSGGASAEHGTPGTTQLVTRPDGPGAPVPGAVNSAQTESPDAVSANGRFMVFTSASDGLSNEDDDSWTNVFVRDAQTGSVTLVSRATGATGAAAHSGSRKPAISADGKRVAFATSASLDPADTNNRQDVYMRDLTTNATTLISRTDGGAGPVGNGNSDSPSLSSDGKHIAFVSGATNLSSGDTHGHNHVYVRDLTQQSTSLVSRATGVTGAIGDNDSSEPSISDDGVTIVFTSTASNLAAPGNRPQVFRRDLNSSVTTLESRNTSGTVANSASYYPSISGDGKTIAFVSNASNLDPADTDTKADVFVRDLTGSSTTLVSRQNGLAGAVQDRGADVQPSISTNGQTIAFSTQATNLSSADTNGAQDVYVRTLAGSTTLASRATGAAGAIGDKASNSPALSGDGTKLYFSSQASNLGSGSPDFRQVILRDLGAQTTAFVSRPAGSAPFAGDDGGSSSQGGYSQVSEDGRYVVFGSTADRFSTADDNRFQNIFVRDTLLDRTVLVSQGAGGAAANGSSDDPTISADGSTVAFTSGATNLVAGDTNGYSDLFIRKLATGQTTRIAATNADTGPGMLSANGAAVAFVGRGQFVTGITSNRDQIYLRNVASGATILISRATGASGTVGDEDSSNPSLSADASKVAFASYSSNLATGVSGAQMYVRNVAANTTTLVSRPGGTSTLPDSDFGDGFINGAGTVVAFSSYATNLIPGDINAEEDVFVRNLAANTTALVSRADGPAGFQGNHSSYTPSLSADGSKIVFLSDAANLVPADTGDNEDVFVRDLAAGTTIAVSVAPNGRPGGGYDASISANGDCVVYYDGSQDTPPAGPRSDFDRGWMRTLARECPVDLPNTKILKGPKSRTTKRRAVFRFGSTEAGSTFLCKLDRRAFRKCGSSYRTPKLKLGRHRLLVRAIDPAGFVDPTPASRKWQIRRPRHR